MSRRGVLSLLCALAASPYVACSQRAPGGPAALHTVGDVRAVHADVRVGDRDVQGERRLSDGDTVTTGADGRARVRLDDGAIVAVDVGTSFTLKGDALELQSGRVFVQGGPAAKTRVTLGDAATIVSGSAAAFSREAGGKSKIYCALGELVVSAAGKQTRVANGDSAVLEGVDVVVSPEKAFDDWTGGLAVPWTSALGEHSAIPVVRALASNTDVGTPLVIRSHKLETTIDGEVATTKTRTRYFNGSSSAASGTLRLALPPGAILTRVARRGPRQDADAEAEVAIAAGPSRAPGSALPGLEWAGGGWLLGNLPDLAAGETLDLALEYTEWLPSRAGHATWRFPMASGEDPAPVGELSAEIDVTRADSRFLSVSAGGNVEGGLIHYRQADARPTGDLVIELSPSVVRTGAARAYVMDGPKGEDPFVMVRTEVPDRTEPGVTLALVVDTSASLGASTLETERAVIDALLEGLGPRDSLVVLAADQTARAVGPAMPSNVTPELRQTLRKALGALRPGGASNLGVALQQAADLLDAPSRGDRAGTGVVVYVGDGRPSVGEPDAQRLRRLVGRRTGGVPRLSAIAVGASADRWLLAKLVAGVGTVYEVNDRADAARAGATLIADALEPTLRDVELDLGSTVDRIYPRDTRAVLAGSTVTVLGRLRGNLPSTVGFRFRDGTRLIEEARPLVRTSLPRGADVPQRWAEARVAETAMRDEGIEPAIALAAAYKLLTPWTSWFFYPPSGGTGTRPFSERVAELSPDLDTPYAARVDDLITTGSTLLEPPRTAGAGVSLEDAARWALRRILGQAAGAVRACRDARSATRPDLGRSFAIDLSVDGGGKATRVVVRMSDARAGDAVLERCIEGVVRSLPFFAAGVSVGVQHTLTVPEGRAASRTQCSEVSKVALPLRKSIWRNRDALDAQSYVKAARACELPRWTERRAYLLLALEKLKDGVAMLTLAEGLEAAGEQDAASFVRKEALRRVTVFSELEVLSQRLLQGEPDVSVELDKAYKKANSDEARLAVVRRFLRLAPHDGLARRRLLALLEALGQKEALVTEIEALRAEPFADAGLLALGASALRRAGFDAEGRRAFGELIERAPRDPWTLAYVGDRLRAEGMFDEAGAAYESLARMTPDDAGVTLRLALAHAGAGRLDVAARLLERVTQTGGRDGDGRLGELASITEAVLLARARGGGDAAVEAQLERRLLQTPLPDVQSVVMVQAAPADDAIEVSVLRERGEREPQSADLDARALGLAAIRIERDDGAARISLRRKLEPGPSRPVKVVVSALLIGRETGVRIVTREVDVAADGKAVELKFDGEAFL